MGIPCSEGTKPTGKLKVRRKPTPTKELQEVKEIALHQTLVNILLESVLLVLRQRSKLFPLFIFRCLAPFTQLHFARGMP